MWSLHRHYPEAFELVIPTICERRLYVQGLETYTGGYGFVFGVDDGPNTNGFTLFGVHGSQTERDALVQCLTAIDRLRDDLLTLRKQVEEAVK